MNGNHLKKRQLLLKRINLYIVLFVTLLAFSDVIVKNIHSVKFVFQAITCIVVILLMVFNFYVPRLRSLEKEIYEAEAKEVNDEE